MYKGKGKKYECKNYIGISFLRRVRKVYGRILIERVRKITDRIIGEEQYGFRSGRGSIKQNECPDV